MSFALPDVICHGPREWVRQLNEHGWFTSTTAGVPDRVLDHWCSASRAAVVVGADAGDPVVERLMAWRQRRGLVVLRPLPDVDAAHVSHRLRTLLGTPRTTGEVLRLPAPSHAPTSLLMELLPHGGRDEWDTARTIHVRGPDADTVVREAWGAGWILEGPLIDVCVSGNELFESLSRRVGGAWNWSALRERLSDEGALLWIRGVTTAEQAKAFNALVNEHLRGLTVVATGPARWPGGWLTVEAPRRQVEVDGLRAAIGDEETQRLLGLLATTDGVVGSAQLADGMGRRPEANGDLLEAALAHGVLVETAELVHPFLRGPHGTVARAYLAGVPPSRSLPTAVDDGHPPFLKGSDPALLELMGKAYTGDEAACDHALSLVEAMPASVEAGWCAGMLASARGDGARMAAAAEMLAELGEYRLQLELLGALLEIGHEDSLDAVHDTLAMELGCFSLCRRR